MTITRESNMSFRKILLAGVASIMLSVSVGANAGTILFSATFDISSATGSFSGLAGSSVAATILTDDTCGSNAFFGCSNMNAVLNLNVGGVNLGTNAGWTSVNISAMSDYGSSAPAPFTYVDPVYNDVIFDFSGPGNFRASTGDPDDTSWSYSDATGGNTVAGNFGITSRVPEPGALSLLGLGLAGLGFARRRKI